MTRCVLVHVPALDDGLRRNAMPWLDARPCRPLRVAFPTLPTSLQATLESGQPPGVHGVFGSRRLQDAAPVEMQSTWQKSLSDEAERIRDDRLLAADDSHAACQALDGELQQFCRAHPEANLLLIAGPARRKATAQLDPSAFVPPDSRFEAEGSYLRIADALNESERSLAIRFEGIERVLHGEALLRRAGEHHEAGQAILVAEPGWCFSSSGQLFLGEGSFVAACGSQLESEAQGWPKAIHDTRIAPTRARLLSQEFTGFPERSL